MSYILFHLDGWFGEYSKVRGEKCDMDKNILFSLKEKLSSILKEDNILFRKYYTSFKYFSEEPKVFNLKIPNVSVSHVQVCSINQNTLLQYFSGVENIAELPPPEKILLLVIGGTYTIKKNFEKFFYEIDVYGDFTARYFVGRDPRFLITMHKEENVEKLFEKKDCDENIIRKLLSGLNFITEKKKEEVARREREREKAKEEISILEQILL